MPASQAALGYGSRFSIEDPTISPATLVDMGEIFNITPPNFQADTVDVTHNQSPNSTRETIAGLKTPGDCSFEMNFVPGSASDVLLRNLLNSGAIKNCMITFPNNVTWTFIAAVKGYEVSMPTDDRMTCTVSMQVSGSVTSSV
jgi:predicted secreted protein